jgi:cytochrome c
MAAAGVALTAATLLAATTSCTPPDGGTRPGVSAAAVSAATDAPARFGFGAPAAEARIALWDRDVGPDGVGLPPGRGSVAQGAGVYLARCVACHGVTGTEGPYDVLVGG